MKTQTGGMLLGWAVGFMLSVLITLGFCGLIDAGIVPASPNMPVAETDGASMPHLHRYVVRAPSDESVMHSGMATE